MKKLLVLLGIITFMPTMGFAFILESEMSGTDALRAQGYSESSLRAIDTVISKNKGINSDYKRRFTPKTHGYARVKEYVDPIQDDGMFGEHQINYSNSPFERKFFYVSPLKEQAPVENL